MVKMAGGPRTILRESVLPVWAYQLVQAQPQTKNKGSCSAYRFSGAAKSVSAPLPPILKS